MGGDQEKRRKKQKEIGPRQYKVKWSSTLNTSPNERSELGITYITSPMVLKIKKKITRNKNGC